MNIELRKVHYSKALSEETAAYTAEIWIDGKKRGTTKNDGHGGPDMIWPRDVADEIAAHAKTLPPVDVYGTMIPQSAEMVLNALLDRHLGAKDLKRKLKTKTVFILPDGKMYEMRAPARPRPDENAIVLNDLPFEDALTRFLAVGR